MKALFRKTPVHRHVFNKKTTIITSAAAAAKSLQSCPTLCDPIDGSPLGSPIPGILQARTLEWVAISKVKVKSLSHVRLFVTPWTAAYQAPPSMGFSRQEYGSGLPLPSLHTALTLSKFKSLIFLHGTLHLSSLFHSLYTLLWRRQWQPTPVLLPRKLYGQRSLVGCSPWGHEESDMTERLHFHFSSWGNKNQF